MLHNTFSMIYTKKCAAWTRALFALIQSQTGSLCLWFTCLTCAIAQAWAEITSSTFLHSSWMKGSGAISSEKTVSPKWYSHNIWFYTRKSVYWSLTAEKTISPKWYGHNMSLFGSAMSNAMLRKDFTLLCNHFSKSTKRHQTLFYLW